MKREVNVLNSNNNTPIDEPKCSKNDPTCSHSADGQHTPIDEPKCSKNDPTCSHSADGQHTPTHEK
ncbi:hypothetical protein L1D27_13780 [Vibrio harveyi]|uniref:hypothetical protein n=1 Tax=Vibrio harveyi TaxID=669 RepID=UPI001EFCEAC3|nr:hypothetical protein [Vibrio harveyi]MCG9549474.1 hypothetical protein [Vibrio harveyi]